MFRKKKKGNPANGSIGIIKGQRYMYIEGKWERIEPSATPQYIPRRSYEAHFILFKWLLIAAALFILGVSGLIWLTYQRFIN